MKVSIGGGYVDVPSLGNLIALVLERRAFGSGSNQPIPFGGEAVDSLSDLEKATFVAKTRVISECAELVGRIANEVKIEEKKASLQLELFIFRSWAIDLGRLYQRMLRLRFAGQLWLVQGRVDVCDGFQVVIVPNVGTLLALKEASKELVA